MGVYWLTRQYIAMLVSMTVERAEIAEWGPVQLEMVGSMSALVLTAIDCGAEGVQGTRRPGMMNSMFGALVRLECKLAQAEMFQPSVALASMVGEMQALMFAVRTRRARKDSATRAVDCSVLAQCLLLLRMLLGYLLLLPLSIVGWLSYLYLGYLRPSSMLLHSLKLPRFGRS